MDDLKQISSKLYETEEKLQLIIPEVMRTEQKYYSMYYDFLLHSGMQSAPQREAEAKKKLELEPIANEYLELKLQFKQLLSMKDTLTVISSNMRSMTWVS